MARLVGGSATHREQTLNDNLLHNEFITMTDCGCSNSDVAGDGETESSWKSTYKIMSNLEPSPRCALEICCPPRHGFTDTKNRC
jgi:hypothetical protein